MMFTRIFCGLIKFVIACVGLISLVLLLISNHSKGHINIEDRNQFEKAVLLDKKLLSPNDKGELLEHIKVKFLDPPSTLPYNLQSQKHDPQANIYKGLKFKYPNRVLQFIIELFSSLHALEKGYFVEAGALDGEFLSNTLFLEKELGWNGLLIEPSTESYKKLLNKRRKAWSCHCCLGTKQFPYETLLAYHDNTRDDKMVNLAPREVQSAKSSVINGNGYIIMKENDILNLKYENVQCLPIHSILKTLNVTKIDLFSLDLEGNEFEILKIFPWSEVIVDVWAVEHKATKNLDLSDDLKTADHNFISWFDKIEYDLNLFISFTEDYIFIRRNSSVVNVKITVD